MYRYWPLLVIGAAILPIAVNETRMWWMHRRHCGVGDGVVYTCDWCRR